MRAWGILVLLLLPAISLAQTLTHEGKPPQLIELYTSEGCSSCPPADDRIAQLLDAPGLWQQVIPMAFHVDYWDYLGWQDVMARPAYSQRQRQLKQQGALSAVYTPGWLVDGHEWRGFFRQQPLPAYPSRAAGALKVDINGQQVAVNYQPIDSSVAKYQAHLVLLGFDYQTQVSAGENRGELLQHQFVVLDHQQVPGRLAWQFKLTDESVAMPGRKALAVWLTKENDAQPVQAAAGWLQKVK